MDSREAKAKPASATALSQTMSAPMPTNARPASAAEKLSDELLVMIFEEVRHIENISVNLRHAGTVKTDKS